MRRLRDWVPDHEETTEVSFVKPSLSKPTEKQEEHYLTTEFINDFASKLNM